MSSAAWYINKRRVLAEASLTKIEYPGRIENINPLLPVRNCSPNYSVISYIDNVCCKPSKPVPIVPPPVLGCNLDGGNSLSGPSIILDGNGSSTILDGNGYCVAPFSCNLDAGNSSTVPTMIFDGNGASFILDGNGLCITFANFIDGGNALPNTGPVLDGGNALTESANIFESTN